MWDLGEVVDLEGGMQLIYKGERPLGAGSHGVVFPCKLKLGVGNERRVIDAVVKCEKKWWNGQGGYELHKWEKIPPHENLVKFYGGKVLGSGESELFGALIVLERMNCNLKQLISKYRASYKKCRFRDVVSILQQIVQGLVHLQENGLIHMDLKLENVLVSESFGEEILVKITNFCVSKVLKYGKASLTATFRGTMANMAPEVILAARFKIHGTHNHRITAHADVYSFGKLMWSLFDPEVPLFISEANHFDIQEIDVGHFQSHKVSCQAPQGLCDLIKDCLRFNLKNAKDSRKHGRPSLENLLSALEEIKETSPSVRIGKILMDTLQYFCCLGSYGNRKNGSICCGSPSIIPPNNNVVDINLSYLRWDLCERINLDGGTQLIYERKAPLGEGAYGVVFPCKLKFGEENDYREIDAVVKCEKKEGSSKDGYEIHKWEKIPPHENLVKFYGGRVLEPGESAHFGALIVFERMDCNLKQLISKYRASHKNCTIGEVVSILHQIVQGLVHLQENGLIHLDLKLENVLVSGGFEEEILVKITDFGVSKALKDGKASVTATLRGSMGYMAPELLLAARFKMDSRQSHRITAHADVYSFGKLMCDLFDPELHSSSPFISQGPGFVTKEIKVGDILENKALCLAPKKLCDLTKKCLRFNMKNAKDSRKHGRPSLEELSEALGKMKNCGWINEKTSNKGHCFMCCSGCGGFRSGSRL